MPNPWCEILTMLQAVSGSSASDFNRPDASFTFISGTLATGE